MRDLSIEKRKKGWALVVTAHGERQERLFRYQEDALRAQAEFAHYSEFRLACEFNHYFRPIPT